MVVSGLRAACPSHLTLWRLSSWEMDICPVPSSNITAILILIEGHTPKNMPPTSSKQEPLFVYRTFIITSCCSFIHYGSQVSRSRFHCTGTKSWMSSLLLVLVFIHMTVHIIITCIITSIAVPAPFCPPTLYPPRPTALPPAPCPPAYIASKTWNWPRYVLMHTTT